MDKMDAIKPNMHILFAALRWPPEVFIQRLINGLIDNNVEITVACAQKPGKIWMHHKNFHWLPVPDYKNRFIFLGVPFFISILKSLFKLPKKFFREYKILRQSKNRGANWFVNLPLLGKQWDLIYFSWNSGAILFEQLLDLGIPSIISCRGSQINIAPHNPERKEYRKNLLRTLAKSTAVHCVSDDILQQVVQLGVPRDKVKVIRPAVDPAYFVPSSRKKKPKTLTIITTGSLIWRKGYEYAMLSIFEVIKAGIDASFQIIGSGPELQRVRYTINDLGLENSVKLLGNLLPDDVLNHLQEADVFLLSSLSEGISNAVLEAMSCGLPVVTTDCGGMREAVTDGVEGFVVPIRDPSAMAEKIKILAQNPALRLEMGQNGRERIIRDFNLNDQINEFIELYQSVYLKHSLKG